MSDSSRPGYVRRYLRQGGWWFAAGLATAGLAVWSDWDGTRDVERDLSSGFRVEATVGADYEGGQPIPLSYEHPTFGTTGANAYTWSLEPDFRPGERIDVVANRTNPLWVDFPGDSYHRAPWLWYVLPPLVALVPVAVRWRRVRRTEAGAVSTDPPAPYVVQMRPRRWPARSVVADLYPVEATAGSHPVCSVPLISSGGLPMAGAAFPVQVRILSRFSTSSTASARPWRWLSLRTDEDQVLWPRRRALGPRIFRGQRQFRGTVADVPTPALLQDLPPGRLARGWSTRFLLSGGALVLGVGLAALIVVFTLASESSTREFARNGVEVPAEIVSIDVSDNRVTIAYRPPGAERRVETTATVSYAEDWDEGQQVLAVVDPDNPANPQRALLVADIYDTSLPLFAAALLAVPALLWFVPELLLALRLRRLCRGPWYEAEVLDGYRVTVRPPLGTGLRLGIGQRDGPSCSLVVPVRGADEQLQTLARQPAYNAGWWQAPQPVQPVQPVEPGATPNEPFPPQGGALPYQTFQVAPKTYAGPVLVSGILARGEAVVLRIGDVMIPALRRAGAPKSVASSPDSPRDAVGPSDVSGPSILADPPLWDILDPG